MAGIAGILYFDAESIDKSVLHHLNRGFEDRDSYRTEALWNNELGFLHLSFDKKKDRASISGEKNKLSFLGYQVILYGFFCNKNYLIGEYEKTDIPLDKNTTDSHLIVLQYINKGPEGLAELEGEFAFALWDPFTNTLQCGRDHMGVKPLYYTQTSIFFAFSTEIKSLLNLPEVNKEINNKRCLDFISYIASDQQSTFYKNISKLPPAHLLTVKDRTIVTKRYWQLDIAHTTQFKNSEDYHHSFFNIFKQAVASRITTSHPAGAHLSGGIDSTSIVCIAAEYLTELFPGRLNTFTNVYNHITSCSEENYYQPVLAKYDVIPHFIEGDTILPGEIFDISSERFAEPFFMPHFFVNWHVMKTAKTQGIKIILSGHDGDSAVSYGYGLLPELARKGRFLKLYHELFKLSGNRKKHALKNMSGLIFELFSHMVVSQIKRDFRNSATGSSSLLNPTFINAKDDDKKYPPVGNPTKPIKLLNEKDLHYYNITRQYHPYYLELLDKTAGWFGLNERLPFFDIKLISFCLSIPAEQKLENGLNRAIVRNGLRNILPDVVRTRNNKTDFSPNFLDAYINRDRKWYDCKMDNLSEHLWFYLDKNKVVEKYNTSLHKGRGQSAALTKMLQIFSFSDWLNEQ